MLRSAHKQLLGFGRGTNMPPGVFKTEQNYLADNQKKQILFTQINPERLTAR
jgi:hypothetical protein